MNLSQNQTIHQLQMHNSILKKTLKENEIEDPTASPAEKKEPAVDKPVEKSDTKVDAEVKDLKADLPKEDNFTMVNPSDLTVKALGEYVQNVTSEEILLELQQAEMDGKNRVTALEAIAEALEALN